MGKKKSKFVWAKVGLYVFWIIIGVFIVGLISLYATDFLGAQADVGGLGYVNADESTNGTVGGSTFAGVVCSFYSYAGFFIGGLAVLMVMIAGIIYATSRGQSGGGETGIGLAKNMIIAALSGVLLYMLGTWLLGAPCVDPQGGILSGIFGQLTSPSSNFGGGTSGGGGAGGSF